MTETGTRKKNLNKPVDCKQACKLSWRNSAGCKKGRLYVRDYSAT